MEDISDIATPVVKTAEDISDLATPVTEATSTPPIIGNPFYNKEQGIWPGAQQAAQTFVNSVVNQPPVTNAPQALGWGLHAITGLAQYPIDALGRTIGSLFPAASQFVGERMQKAAQNQNPIPSGPYGVPLSQVSPAYQGLQPEKNFTQQFPRVSQAIQDVTNLAQTVPMYPTLLLGAGKALTMAGKGIEKAAVGSQLSNVSDMATTLKQSILNKFNGANNTEKAAQFTNIVKNNDLVPLIGDPAKLAEEAQTKGSALVDGANDRLQQYTAAHPEQTNNPVAVITTAMGHPDDPLSGTRIEKPDGTVEQLAEPGHEDTWHNQYVKIINSPAIAAFDKPLPVSAVANLKDAIDPSNSLFKKSSSDLETTAYNNLRQRMYYNVIDQIKDIVPEAQADLTQAKDLFNVSNAASDVDFVAAKTEAKQRGLIGSLLNKFLIPGGGLAGVIGGNLIAPDMAGHLAGLAGGMALGEGINIARNPANIASLGRGIQNLGQGFTDIGMPMARGLNAVANVPGQGLNAITNASGQGLNAITNASGQAIDALRNFKFQNRPGSIGGTLSPEEIPAQSQGLKGQSTQNPMLTQAIKLGMSDSEFSEGAELGNNEIKDHMQNNQRLPEGSSSMGGIHLDSEGYENQTPKGNLYIPPNFTVNGNLSFTNHTGRVLLSDGLNVDGIINARGASGLREIPKNITVNTGGQTIGPVMDQFPLNFTGSGLRKIPDGFTNTAGMNLTDTPMRDLPKRLSLPFMDISRTNITDLPKDLNVPFVRMTDMNNPVLNFKNGVPAGVEELEVDNDFLDNISDVDLPLWVNDVNKLRPTDWDTEGDTHYFQDRLFDRLDEIRKNNPSLFKGNAAPSQELKTLSMEDVDNMIVEGEIPGNSIINASIIPVPSGPLLELDNLKLNDNTHVKGDLLLERASHNLKEIPNNFTVDERANISHSYINTIGTNFKAKELYASGSKLNALPADIQVPMRIDISNTPVDKIPSNLKTNILAISGSKVDFLPPNLQVGEVWAQGMPKNFTVSTLSPRISRLMILKSDLPNLLNNIPDSQVPLWINDIQKVHMSDQNFYVPTYGSQLPGGSEFFDSEVQDAYAERLENLDRNNLKGNAAIQMLLGMSGASAAGLAAPKLIKMLTNKQGTPVSQLKKE